MQIQLYRPVPRRCRWFHLDGAGLLFRVPFLGLVCLWWR